MLDILNSWGSGDEIQRILDEHKFKVIEESANHVVLVEPDGYRVELLPDGRWNCWDGSGRRFDADRPHGTGGWMGLAAIFDRFWRDVFL